MTKPNFAKDALKQLVARIERLEAEKAALAADIRAVYAEAKSNGYDTKIMRRAVKIRATDVTEREEQAALLDLYLSALSETVVVPMRSAAE